MTPIIDPSSFGLSQIGQIAINTRDLTRSVAYYRDKLGMRHLFTVPPNMAFFDCGGIRLMLSLPEKPEFDHPGSIIYFTVEDIHKSATTLIQRGVEFEQEPRFVADMGSYELWMAFFRDCDNNPLALMSNVAKKSLGTP